MNNTAIEFNNVSKKYRLRKGFYRSEALWALKNVSFEVEEGQSLGIIGPNGAGKTTILKLLAGITEPTAGSIRVRGSTGSLIDLTAGCNPELSGRENIILQGSILRFSRKEIYKKFDEIVEFAGLKKFIDEPIKYYSSGMLVRLGFSIAVHTDPQILFIDEVLAVGDINFRRKCITKIQEFMNKKKTFVIVSHDLFMIRSVCQNVLYLSRGSVKEGPSPEKALTAYIKDSYKDVVAFFMPHKAFDIEKGEILRSGTGEIRVTGVKLIDKNGKETNSVEAEDDIAFEIHYKATKEIINPWFILRILDTENRYITETGVETKNLNLNSVSGEGALRCVIKSPPLLPGIYCVSVVISDKAILTLGSPTIAEYDRWDRALSFEIASSKEPLYMLSSGLLRVDAEWEKE